MIFLKGMLGCIGAVLLAWVVILTVYLRLCGAT